MVHVTRPAAGTSDRAPYLLLMHGLGSDEQDLLGLGVELDNRVEVISLRAPHRYEYGGFAWFDVAWTEAGVQVDERAAKQSRDVVVDFIATLDATRPLFVGGFSQGAMMSLGVTMATPGRVSGALLFSGRLLPAFSEPSSVAIANVPFLVQHGTVDPVLPVEGARVLRDRLVALQCVVDYHEYPMAHQISPDSFMDAQRWLRDHLAAPTTG